MTETLITDVKLSEIPKLSNLFKRAVNEDYSFYDQKVKNLILRRNTPFKIYKAVINPSRMVLKSTYDGKLTGLLIGSLTYDGIGVVSWLYVSPEYRNKGAAKTLLSKAESEFKRLGCHKVVVSTEIAQNFYKKVGYEQEGVLKNHWWGKDFYLFCKFLP